ncbi:RusA family crossover junction endodeoxyribonuclease [Candidatus Babeliales bacterium]|nr:RusA family crossover junction endodeoxyribonuclease [Candidatus Babeliales bacterium]
MKKYVIPDLPPTDNHLYGQHGHIRFLTKAGKDWKYMAGMIVKTEYKKKPAKDEVEFGEIRIYLKNWRDIQGSLKIFFDSFEGILYVNDRQVKKFGPVVKYHDKKNPRIEFYF